MHRVSKEVCIALCERFPLDECGRYLDGKAVLAHLQLMRPDMDSLGAVKIFDRYFVLPILGFGADM